MKIGINTPLFQWDANAEADAMQNLARAAAEAKATIKKKQDIIETKNNTTNIQYQVVQFKGS